MQVERMQWLDAYLEGATLKEVAQIEGVKKQAISQRLESLGIPTRSASETRALKLQKIIEREGPAVTTAFLEIRDISEISAQFGLSRDGARFVVQSLVPEYEVLTRAPRALSKRYTETELLECLREAAASSQSPLTTKAYGAHSRRYPDLHDGRPRPTVQSMFLRFGSWRNALALAGLTANPRSGPNKRYSSTTEAVCSLVGCWSELQQPPTVAAYDLWQRGRQAHPSAATLRKLFGGSWTTGLVQAWQIRHGIQLDQEDDILRLPPELVPSAEPVTYQPADEEATSKPSVDLSLRDYLAMERAVRSHARIQNAIAAALRAVNIQPLSPAHAGVQFDIAFQRSGASFVVIEVKSCTAANLEFQLRLGLGQVLRYAHQLRLTESTIVPVLATELQIDPSWKDALFHSGVELIQEPTLVTDVQRIALRVSRGDPVEQ